MIGFGNYSSQTRRFFPVIALIELSLQERLQHLVEVNRNEKNQKKHWLPWSGREA